MENLPFVGYAQEGIPKGAKTIFFHNFCSGFEGPRQVPELSPGLAVHFPVENV